MGVDVADVADWAARLRRTPQVAAVAFTERELAATAADPRALAEVWAVKEAVLKAFGTGFDGIGWRGIEVAPTAGGARTVRLAGGRPPPDFPRVLHGAVRELAGSVLAAVVAAPGLGRGPSPRLRAAVVAVPAGLPRGERGRAHSAAARLAGRRAWEDLCSGSGRPAGPVRWGRTEAGAPLLRTAEGRLVPVALAHGAGLAAALVALPAAAPYRPGPSSPFSGKRNGPGDSGPGAGKPSLELTIIAHDNLLKEVTVHA
ncbi:4'-phosphopantetheinyl transferase superfamily protein [Kitasatospora sp. NPDC048194]|uniref:4'-phosphopantetheinyl transferase superfamily protein n=1 Tax=Kitasatospora sp. NPDC048194 TaxID=3364045 RepID=UPI00371780BE